MFCRTSNLRKMTVSRWDGTAVATVGGSIRAAQFAWNPKWAAGPMGSLVALDHGKPSQAGSGSRSI